MSDYEEQQSFVDVHFDITQDRVKSFLELFAPTYKGYILDQTPKQLHSKEYIIRIGCLKADIKILPKFVNDQINKSVGGYKNGR
jgi:hypothetical protein